MTSNRRAYLLATFRILAAALVLGAIAFQYETSMAYFQISMAEFQASKPQFQQPIVELQKPMALSTSRVVFFSYFTNWANLAAAAVFIVAAYRELRKKSATLNFDLLRGTVAVQMLQVGLVFNTLLRDADLGSLLPSVNVVIHMIMPLAVLIDWLIDPPKSWIPWKALPIWFLPNIVYTIYTFSRASYTGWYPYPFMNPDKVGGYQGVALYGAGVAVLVFVVSLFVRWTGNRRHRAL